jgi:hypothetical protein
MPNFKKHLAINSVTLAVVEVVLQFREMERDPVRQFDWGRAIVNVGVGSMAGALPDWLEPSLGNPNHRGFCHSLGAAIVVWWLVSGRHTHDLPEDLKRVLFACGIGYSAHLGADLFLSHARGMGLVHPRF